MKRMTLAILATLSLFFAGCSQVDTGNVGVVKTGGQYKVEELPPGWHLTWFSTVDEVSGKENLIEFQNLKPKTADQITIEDLDIDVYYQLNVAKASETMGRLAGDLTKNSAGDYVPGINYVTRTAREAIYDVMSTIAAADAQAKRTTVPTAVQRTLQAELDSKFEKGWFTVTNVNMRNLTVDSNLETKIREAAQMTYEIETKRKQVELAKAEAERQRAVAQGEADATRIKAEALKTAQSTAYIDQIRLQNEAEAIKKWDGALPSPAPPLGVPCPSSAWASKSKPVMPLALRNSLF